MDTAIQTRMGSPRDTGQTVEDRDDVSMRGQPDEGLLRRAVELAMHASRAGLRASASDWLNHAEIPTCAASAGYPNISEPCSMFGVQPSTNMLAPFRLNCASLTEFRKFGATITKFRYQLPGGFRADANNPPILDLLDSHSGSEEMTRGAGNRGPTELLQPSSLSLEDYRS